MNLAVQGAHGGDQQRESSESRALGPFGDALNDEFEESDPRLVGKPESNDGSLPVMTYDYIVLPRNVANA